MPQTKFQKFIFSLLMSYIMAYGMELANVAVKLGGMSNAVFLPALKEASYMGAFVFLVSNLYGNRVGRAIAFRCVQPGRDAPFFITLMISSCSFSTKFTTSAGSLSSFAGEIIQNHPLRKAPRCPPASF